MFDLKDNTILLTLAGSQAHGTAREGSDVDVRGVCIAPINTRLSLFESFEQYDGLLPGSFKPLLESQLSARPEILSAMKVKAEAVVYDIAKFVGLCAKANPNALEILFADPDDWLYHNEHWDKLNQHRMIFLTQKVRHTFAGYALAQLKKIKTHRAWLLNPPAAKPTREKFGLPDASTLSRDDQDRIERSLAERLRAYGLNNIDMSKAARLAVEDCLREFWTDTLSTSEEELSERMRALSSSALGIPKEVIKTLNAERKYRGAMGQWQAYQSWKTNRNPARAKLEAEHGYDTKHAMHLIRLMRMGLEAIRDGELRVRRPDAAELLEIRDGALSYDKLIEQTDELKQNIDCTECRLPEDIDRRQVDELVLSLIR
ncbi:MAG: nucleotidyltransferase domain-containing protein [Planctomycetota bacterium]